MGGLPAYLIIYKVGKVYYLTILSTDNHREYSIGYQSKTEYFSENLSLVEQIINSFEQTDNEYIS